MKLKPILPQAQLDDVQADFDSALKVERWRIGEKAFYQPAGFNSASYLPLEKIRSAYPHDFRVKGGCSCAGTVPAGGVVITYGESGVIKVVPGSDQKAKKILEVLKERIPGLDTEIPEIYRNRTRDPL